MLARELAALDGLPVVAVLGNHDYESDAVDDVRAVLEAAGAIVLDGDGTTVARRRRLHRCRRHARLRWRVPRRRRLGVRRAGDEGVRPAHTATWRTPCRALADELDCDIRVALTHYAPVPETVQGERPEIFPFLGSYLLAEAIDGAAPTWRSTATPTGAAVAAARRAACPCATSPSRCSAARTPCSGSTPKVCATNAEPAPRQAGDERPCRRCCSSIGRCPHGFDDLVEGRAIVVGPDDDELAAADGVIAGSRRWDAAAMDLGATPAGDLAHRCRLRHRRRRRGDRPRHHRLLRARTRRRSPPPSTPSPCSSPSPRTSWGGPAGRRRRSRRRRPASSWTAGRSACSATAGSPGASPSSARALGMAVIAHDPYVEAIADATACRSSTPSSCGGGPTSSPCTPRRRRRPRHVVNAATLGAAARRRLPRQLRPGQPRRPRRARSTRSPDGTSPAPASTSPSPSRSRPTTRCAMINGWSSPRTSPPTPPSAAGGCTPTPSRTPSPCSTAGRAAWCPSSASGHDVVPPDVGRRRAARSARGSDCRRSSAPRRPRAPASTTCAPTSSTAPSTTTTPSACSRPSSPADRGRSPGCRGTSPASSARSSMPAPKGSSCRW